MFETNTILESLNNQVCEFKFTKKDGTVREMEGTRNINYVPGDKIPKSGQPTQSESNPDFVKVFALDVNEWRSFYVKDLIEFTPTDKEIFYG